MSPLGSFCSIKPDVAALQGDALFELKMKQGHPLFGVEFRITDDENRELPWDGKTFGRLKVRGPAVAKAYFRRPESILDEDGFFDTGDVATIDAHGYMHITDRAKDVIKSGGEWISSIELENLAVGHPDVAEAAVIGVQPSEMGRAPAPRHRPEGGQKPSAGGPSRLHPGPGRQMVGARRRRLRRPDPAHGHRQDPEDRAARDVPRLSPAEPGYLTAGEWRATRSFVKADDAPPDHRRTRIPSREVVAERRLVRPRRDPDVGCPHPVRAGSITSGLHGPRRRAGPWRSSPSLSPDRLRPHLAGGPARARQRRARA